MTRQMIEGQDQVSRETMHCLIIENNHLSLLSPARLNWPHRTEIQFPVEKQS